MLELLDSHRNIIRNAIRFFYLDPLGVAIVALYEGPDEQDVLKNTSEILEYGLRYNLMVNYSKRILDDIRDVLQKNEDIFEVKNLPIEEGKSTNRDYYKLKNRNNTLIEKYLKLSLILEQITYFHFYNEIFIAILEDLDKPEEIREIYIEAVKRHYIPYNYDRGYETFVKALDEDSIAKSLIKQVKTDYYLLNRQQYENIKYNEIKENIKRKKDLLNTAIGLCQPHGILATKAIKKDSIKTILEDIAIDKLDEILTKLRHLNKTLTIDLKIKEGNIGSIIGKEKYIDKYDSTFKKRKIKVTYKDVIFRDRKIDMITFTPSLDLNNPNVNKISNLEVNVKSDLGDSDTLNFTEYDGNQISRFNLSPKYAQKPLGILKINIKPTFDSKYTPTITIPDEIYLIFKMGSKKRHKLFRAVDNAVAEIVGLNLILSVIGFFAGYFTNISLWISGIGYSALFLGLAYLLRKNYKKEKNYMTELLVNYKIDPNCLDNPELWKLLRSRIITPYVEPEQEEESPLEETKNNNDQNFLITS